MSKSWRLGLVRMMLTVLLVGWLWPAIAPVHSQNSPLVQASTPQDLTFTGTLDRRSPKLETAETYFNTHTFTGQAGEGLKIDLTSTDFDTVLILRNAAGEEILRNDDAIEGDSADSRIYLVLPRDGDYELVVTTFEAKERGTYQLTVDRPERLTQEVQTEAELYSDSGWLLQLEPFTEEELREAIADYETALALYQSANLFLEVGKTYSLIGDIYQTLGQWEITLEQKSAAIKIFEQLDFAIEGEGVEPYTSTNLKPHLGQVAYDLGSLQYTFGDLASASHWFNTAYGASAVGSELEAAALRGEAQVLADLGEGYDAITTYEESLQIYRDLNDRQGQAETLEKLAILYGNLNDNLRFLELTGQALGIYFEMDDASGVARVLNIWAAELSTDYDADGFDTEEFDELAVAFHELMLSFYESALELAQSTGDVDTEAEVFGNLSRLYANQKNWSVAQDYAQRSLSLYQAKGQLSGVAQTFNTIGFIEERSGQITQALVTYQKALNFAQQVGDRAEIAEIHANLASFHQQQGDLNSALEQIEAAIAIIEELRQLTPPGQLRQSYFATAQDDYELYLELLMALHDQKPNQGYADRAFQVSESRRARILLEQLTEANVDLRADAFPEDVAREAQLQRQLNRLDQQRIELLNQPSGYQQDTLDAIEDDITQTLRELDAAQNEIRFYSSAYADLTFPEPLDLKAVQEQVLDDETLLLEYALGETQSFLFVVSKANLITYTLPPRTDIEASVEDYLEKLRSPQFKDLGQGQRLSQMLLGQAQGQLQGQRLAIVADGKLQLLPFGALPNPLGTNVAPLLAQHEIVMLPSATSAAVQKEKWAKRRRAPNKLAMFADPVFEKSDPRLGEYASTEIAGDLSQFDSLIRSSCGDFDRLPHTATEAEAILKLVPDSEAFKATGFAATQKTVTQTDLSQYQIVHLATHGCIRDNPLLSNLAMSFYQENGKATDSSLLKLQDIYNLELNADLVVLSACETGTGKDIQGEGIVGLTRGFMYAGARRVVVSLWSVSDRATSDLMADYYQQMLEENLEPAAALRQIQLNAWNSGQWQSPYYWAAFTIQGDW